MCEFDSKTCNFAKQIQQPNSLAMNRFFKPFVGTKYEEGICGKKILVLGASFYCDKNGENGRMKCPFFSVCTNTDMKDSSAYDEKCPYPECEGKHLSDYPTTAIEEQYKPYQNFQKFIQSVIGNGDYEETWNRMSFTDYVQFFVPTIKTERSYLSTRDFDAFCETLRELKPDVVISWGMAILEDIRENNNFITDLECLSKTEYFVCHMKLPDIEHEITLVSCYHPSSRQYWHNDMEKLRKYVKQVLEK